MRVAVIGRGSIGSRHAINALALGHEVLSYDDAQRAQWVEQREHRACSLQELADYTPDAMLICTPASTHAAVARALLEAGYDGPLFVEKPIATSLADCEIFRAWPSPVQQVGYNWRFHEEMTAYLAEPSLWLHFECGTDMASWPGACYAAPLLECSHEVDLALSLGAQFGLAGVDATAAWLQFQAPSILIDLRWKADSLEWRGRSHRALTRGTFRSHGWCADRRDLDLGDVLDRSYVRELEHFLACARSGTTPACTFTDGMRVLEVIDQAEQQSGRR